MKRVVVSALLAACLAQPAAQAVAQTVSDQCFAIGDIAGQVASWRAHKKTKAQALDQAARYYKDPADRQTVDAIIEKIFSPDAPHMTPDQASMAFTSACVKRKHEQAPAQ
jgi:sugar lactone lactonase YvrE